MRTTTRLARAWGLLWAWVIPAGTALGVELPQLDCVIEPHVVVSVSSPVEGLIEDITVDRSDRVEKGQVIAELESGVQKAAVALARAQAELSGEIDARKTSYDFDKRKRQRVAELFKKNAIPFHEKDQADTNAAVAGLQLQQAKENKRLAQLELRRAIEILKQRTIRSPISGVVIERSLSPGEFIVDDRPMVKLAQIDPLRVEVIAPLGLFGAIHKGMHAEINPEADIEGDHVARVTVVDKIIDAASGTFGIRLELPNLEHRIPGGLRCKLRFFSEAEEAELEALRKAPVEPKPVPVSPTVNDLLTDAPRRAHSPYGNERRLCQSIGPFENAEQADQLSRSLVDSTTPLQTYQKPQSKIVGYRVLTPPMKSIAAAKTLAAMLEKKGVKDLWVILKGAQKRRISLGQYKGKKHAQKRLRQIASLGFDANIEPVVKRSSKVWLEVEGDTNIIADDALRQLVAKSRPDLRVETTPCPQTTAQAGRSN